MNRERDANKSITNLYGNRKYGYFRGQREGGKIKFHFVEKVDTEEKIERFEKKSEEAKKVMIE